MHREKQLGYTDPAAATNMENNIKKRIADGKPKKTNNMRGKAENCSKFQLVTMLDDKPSSFVQ